MKYTYQLSAAEIRAAIKKHLFMTLPVNAPTASLYVTVEDSEGHTIELTKVTVEYDEEEK